MLQIRVLFLGLAAILATNSNPVFAGVAPLKADVTFPTGETVEADLRIRISQTDIGFKNTVCAGILIWAAGNYLALSLVTPAYQIAVAGVYVATAAYLMARSVPQKIPLEIWIPGKKPITLSNNSASMVNLIRGIVWTGTATICGKPVPANRLEIKLCVTAKPDVFFLCDAKAVLEKDSRRFDLLTQRMED